MKVISTNIAKFKVITDTDLTIYLVFMYLLALSGVSTMLDLQTLSKILKYTAIRKPNGIMIIKYNTLRAS